MRRLLSVDPLSGMKVYHEYNHLTDETTLIYEDDVTPLLEVNKAMANDPDLTKQGIKDEFWLYASIPNIIITKWLIEKGVDVYNKDHAKKVGELLNSPEYKYLKTTAGYHKFKG